MIIQNLFSGDKSPAAQGRARRAMMADAIEIKKRLGIIRPGFNAPADDMDRVSVKQTLAALRDGGDMTAVDMAEASGLAVSTVVAAMPILTRHGAAIRIGKRDRYFLYRIAEGAKA